MIPLLASVVAGRGDPAAIGAGLAAFQQGRRLKLAEREQEQERQSREDRERADFYGRVVQNAQQFDDPVAFEQWKQAIAPMAQVYGVPLDAITFSDTKRQAKAQKEAQSAIDLLRKVHGDKVDDPAWQYAHRSNGQRISDIYRMANLTVTDSSGAAVRPSATSEKATPGSFADFLTATPERRAEITAAKAAFGGGDGDGPADLSRSGLDVQLADAKRRAARGDAGAAADVKLLEETILKADTLRRDPHITVNTGGTNPKTQSRIDRIVSSFDNSPIVKNFNDVQERLATINSILASKTVGGPSDLAIVYEFMKALDPTSVVRESEYATASRSGNVFLGAMARFNGYFKEEGGFMPEQVKREFAAIIRSKFEARTKQYENLRKEKKERIDAILSGKPETGDEALTNYQTAIPDVAGDTSAVPGAVPTYQDYLNRKKGGR